MTHSAFAGAQGNRMAPREGLEPPRLAAARKQRAASSIFAIWEYAQHVTRTDDLSGTGPHVA